MRFETISNHDISLELLFEVAKLKKQHWDYPVESQIDWFKSNLEPDDIHLLLWDNKKLIAYLSIVNVLLNDRDDYLGIGTVCVDIDYIGRSIGFLLVQISNFYIRNKRKNGILLCKENLIPFYTKCGYFIFNGEVLIKNDKFHHITMLTKKLNDKNIKLNRNF